MQLLAGYFYFIKELKCTDESVVILIFQFITDFVHACLRKLYIFTLFSLV